MTMTWGMWFSTASIITSCWSDGVRTCMRRALPMAGCGMSPSPAISLLVSTTTTRLPMSSARTRAASRSIVVLPMPGRPMIRIDFPVSTKSLMISIVPKTARPMRQVSPTTLPLRLRIALMRWRVRSIPARLSSPKVPMWSTTNAMSDSVISRSSSVTSESREPALGPPAQVEDDLDEGGPVGQRVHRVDDLRRQCREEDIEVVDGLELAVRGCHADLRYRTPAGTRAGSATRTRVSFMSSVTLAIESNPASSRRRSIGDS